MPRGKPNKPKADPAADHAQQESAAPTHGAARPEPLKTVPMVRAADTNPPPHAADVHPDEVENWQAHGWRVAD